MDWGYTNIYFIPNGVDTKIFKLREPSNTGFFNVLYAGRLTEDKGADALLGIIRYVNEELRIRNIKFTICGFGPFKKFVEEVARKYANVEYLGFVSHKMLPKIYGEADLFLIPSKSEEMPLGLLEAQSCGLPAVGSNIPGISDVIVNGKTGRLVHSGNIASLAEAIKEYYLLWRHSPEQYYEMSRTIREHIVNNYDWNSIIGKIENMFKETLTNTM
jgi:glycosyltransferase involved in cell wall biosynthesis